MEVVASISRIKSLLPDAALEPVVVPTGTRVDLPPAPEADYHFQLWFYDDGERQIHASLDAPGTPLGATFWYHPFELAAYRGGVAPLARDFDAELLRLLQHDTRVHQRRGCLFWSFSLQLKRGNAWERVYSFKTLRGAFDVPHVPGREKVYSSRALVR